MFLELHPETYDVNDMSGIFLNPNPVLLPSVWITGLREWDMGIILFLLFIFIICFLGLKKQRNEAASCAAIWENAAGEEQLAEAVGRGSPAQEQQGGEYRDSREKG